MMADDSNKCARFITLVLFILLVSEVNSQCADGVYKHDGRDCCLCGAGLRVVEHCTTNQHKGKCEPCQSETYSIYPNDQMSCDPCRSCSQINENLEEDEPCTPGRNRKCRCKKDHYCTSSTDICRLCNPCQKCGAEGTKVACTGSNNTVCNDKIEGGNHVGTIVGSIIGVILLIALIVAGVMFFRKKNDTRKEQMAANLTNGNAAVVEMQLLGDVDLEPHLPDIADVIGWKEMQGVAMRSMTGAFIESFKLSHPGDSQEQTLQLLRAWVERQGREAGNNLIEILQDRGKKATAERVTAILSAAR